MFCSLVPFVDVYVGSPRIFVFLFQSDVEVALLDLFVSFCPVQSPLSTPLCLDFMISLAVIKKGLNIKW